MDIEDLGKVGRTSDNKEMITPTLRKALTKQGYRLIGTHSGVKLCRWTKVRRSKSLSFIIIIIIYKNCLDSRKSGA